MAPSLRKASTKRLTALVVDSHSDTRDMYTEYLSSQGINTIEAFDGRHGLAKASTSLPDVITTDLHLPNVDGAALCRLLKQQVRTRDIPVIAVTGTASLQEIAAAWDAGCVSVLLKPCLPATLLEEIHRVVAERPVGKPQR